MQNFQDFSGTHILREINSGHFQAPKFAILTIYAALNFDVVYILDIFMCDIFKKVKIQNLQNYQNDIFWTSEIYQN